MNISYTSTSPTAPITTELHLNDWDGLDDHLNDIMISVFSEEDYYEPDVHTESDNDDGECSDDQEVEESDIRDSDSDY